MKHLAVITATILALSFAHAANQCDQPVDLKWQEYKAAHPELGWDGGTTKKYDELRNRMERFQFKIQEWRSSGKNLLGLRQLGQSLLLCNGRLLFIQPDGSLTLIELESGKILARRRLHQNSFSDEKPVHRLWINHWRGSGRYALGYAGYANKPCVIIDTENGDVVDEIDGITLLHNDKIYYPARNNIFSLNVLTGEKVSLMENIAFPSACLAKIMGNTFICIGREETRDEFPRNRVISLRSFSIADNSLFWQKKCPENEDWLAIACDRGKIFVFSAQRGSTLCDQVRVYDVDGAEYETIIPTPELFGGAIPKEYIDYFDFSFNGVRHIGFFGDEKPGLNTKDCLPFLWQARELLQQRFGLSVYPQTAVQLTDNAFAWIECEPDDLSTRLYYRDNVNSWSGQIRSGFISP